MSRKPLTSGQLAHIADRFKALAEPSRLEILNALRSGEQTVSALLDATGLAQANASRHLQVLYTTGFVERRKEGLSTYYRLADPDVLRLCDMMCGRLGAEALHKKRLFSGAGD